MTLDAVRQPHSVERRSPVGRRPGRGVAEPRWPPQPPAPALAEPPPTKRPARHPPVEFRLENVAVGHIHGSSICSLSLSFSSFCSSYPFRRFPFSASSCGGGRAAAAGAGDRWKFLVSSLSAECAGVDTLGQWTLIHKNLSPPAKPLTSSSSSSSRAQRPSGRLLTSFLLSGTGFSAQEKASNRDHVLRARRRPSDEPAT